MKRINKFPYNRGITSNRSLSLRQALEMSKNPSVNLGNMTNVEYAFVISRKIVDLHRLSFTFGEWTRRINWDIKTIPHFSNGKLK